MLDFSFGKLVIVALIALIVLGPEKLPHAARTVGALVRRVRSGWDGVRAEVERELEFDELRRAAKKAAADAEEMQKQAKEALSKLNAEAEKARDKTAELAHAVETEVADIEKTARTTTPALPAATATSTTDTADGQA